MLKTNLTKEKEAGNEPGEAIASFLKESSWKVVDNPRDNQVSLTRTHGSENLKVIFDIMGFDPTLDEKEGEQKPEEEEAQPEGLNDVPFSVVISKKDASGKDLGSLVFRLSISKPQGSEGGELEANLYSFFYVKESEVIGSLEEEDYYQGPALDSLGEEWRDVVFQFLEERGVDGNLLQFVTEYRPYKENNEYMNWLNDCNTFLTTK